MTSDPVTKSTQRHSLLGIVSLFLSLCMVVGYALVMDGRRSDTIAELSTALAEQRAQFSECTEDQPRVPASTCDEPVADEPAKIVKDSEETSKGLAGTTPITPTTIIGPTGPAGPSAYQVAIANGFRGSVPSWLSSLKGPSGLMGAPGLAGPSAYQIAQEHGFTGSEAQWLASLAVQGPPGPSGPPGLAGRNGLDGDDGAPGLPGKDGASGAAGTNGSDGRGISVLQCLSDGTWRVTYTDGTTSTTSGPCIGARGPAGEKGSDGAKGSPGSGGTPGQDGCPAGSANVDEVSVLLANGEPKNIFACVP